MLPAITVTKSGIVPAILVAQDARGNLFSIEERNLPFELKRTYAIYGVKESDIARGAHAHFKTDQVIFAIQGSFTLALDDGQSVQELTLSAGKDGVRLGPMLWHSMSNFTPDAVALVAASLPYDEADYIRDYGTFKQHASTH